MISLEKTLEAFHQHHGIDKTIWIAYSGGLDSHVLLHLYHRLRHLFPITMYALYINHGLHPKAAAWSLHCKKICQAYQVDFLEKSIHIALKPGESLEEAAREKRYAAFQSYMNKGDLLLTGHHQDDQAETALIQLIRGAGLKGLAAMPDFKQWGKGYHGRPLLAFSKKVLQQYANLHQLHWIHDDTNEDTTWTRNFIRHELLPSLKKRWPSVTKTIARSAHYSAEAQSLLEEFALGSMDKMLGTAVNTLSVQKLLQSTPTKQRLILRTWIHCLGHSLPSSNKIQAIQKNVLKAGTDRMPSVCWKQTVVRRYRDDLYLTTIFPKHDKKAITPWRLTHPLILPGIGQLTAAKSYGKGLHASIQEVSVRFRQGGEIIRIPGRGRQILKHLLQEWGIPPWQRNRIPLIFAQEKLIGLVGFSLANYICDEYAAKSNEMGVELFLQETTVVHQTC